MDSTNGKTGKERPNLKVNRVEERVDISFDALEASSLYAYIEFTKPHFKLYIERLKKLVKNTNEDRARKEFGEQLEIFNQIAHDMVKIQKEAAQIIEELDTVEKDIIIKKPNF